MKTNSKCTRFVSLLLILLTIFSLAGCARKDSKDQDSTHVQGNSEESKTQSGGVKSDGYDKFSKLKIGMTKSEVNAILGEPAKVDKAYYYYDITVNGQDLELTVWIDATSGLVTNLYGDFSNDKYRMEFADSATDLSTVSDLDSGKIDNYDACKTAFKTPGFLISIDEDGVKEYLWVNTDDGHMTVTFKADGSVKTYIGVC